MKSDFHPLPRPVSPGPDSLPLTDSAVGIFKQPRFSGVLRFLQLLAVFVFSSAAHAIDFTYTTSNGAVTITGYIGAGGAVAIPGTINALPVTNIGDYAFENTISVTSITIPSSVTRIGDYAFQQCSSMTTATLPGSITSIGTRAFNDCSKLTGTVIPNSVITIGADAFLNCTSLTSVSIGSGVTSIGNSAFTGCSNLTAFTVDAANTQYSSLAGVLFNKAQTLLIQYPARKTGSYTIPNSVTTIASFAFLNSASLTGITIPNSVTDIGDRAFLNCTGLTGVTIPDAVANIGTSAFSGCSSLTGVSIGSGALTIGDSAFYECYNLSAINVAPANPAYSSPDGVFHDKNQTTLIQYPARKTGSYAVLGSVTSIAADAFDTCTSLTSIFIPGSVTSIGQWAFYGCANLTSITIPTSITSIQTGTFAECIKLTSVTISNSVTSIGRSAFSGCIQVTGVTFGENVATIGDSAFSGCSVLARATFTGGAPALEGEVFSGTASTFKVYYTTGSAGFATPTWNGYPSVATTGAMPEIELEQPAGTPLTAGVSTSIFAPTATNLTAVNTFTLRNTGTDILRDILVTKDGPHAAEFTVAVVPTTLAAGASVNFTITFKPAAIGMRTAQLHIASSDPNENPFVIQLSGEGTGPGIEVELLPENTPLTDAASIVDYGQVVVNLPKVQTFSVRNSGTGTLSGLAISKTGTNSADFTVSAPGATTLAPGATTTFTVTFKPAVIGARNAAISIASNVVGTKNPFTVSLTGTGISPEIAVELEGGINLVDGNTTALSYGSVLVDTQLVKTFTIRNTGTADLTGLTITQDGTNSADFTVITSPVAPVPPGGSTTFSVRFHPSAVGTRVASIYIANNDLNENPFDIKLTGTGVAPNISVEQPAATVLTDGVSVVNYGSSIVATGLARVFTIKNPGTYPLTDLSILIDGTHSNDFTLTAAPATSIAAGGSTTFTITFQPSALGVRNAAIHIASNVTGTKNPFDITLAGTGILPDISVEQPAATILTDGASTVTFTPTLINTTKANTFTIRNTGSATLSGISITKDGPNAADFTIGTVATSVGVNSTTTFTVTFKPSAVGPREATIRIASNDPDENPFDIALSGTGIAPDIAVELMPDNPPLADGTGTVPFGVVAVAATKVRTLTVRNTGTSTLSGLVISKTGTNSAEFTVSALGATTLAPGLTTTFTVTFKPTALGARTATLNIANNVVGTKNPFTINLSGGLSDEARLAGLAISEGELSPAFASGVFAYAAEVGNSTGSIAITPTVMQAGATVKVNGVTVASGSASAGIPLATGPNPITTVVTAPDGVTTQTYVLTVTPSADPYADWSESQNLTAGNSGLLDDPDHDGSLNLLEYAFDTDPLSGKTGPLTLNGATITSHGTPFIAESPGPVFHAVFGRRSDYVAAGLTYRVQFSTDMNAWTDSEAVPTVLADDGVIQAVSVPFPAGAKQFFRVLVTGPPN